MPASNRRRTAVAALACFLAAMAAPGGAKAAPSPVELDVTSTGAVAPTYRIAVRNGSSTDLDATVRQELPEGVAPISVSEGGQVTNPAGQSDGLEVSWRLRLSAGGEATLGTTLSTPPAATDLTAPACVFPGDGTVPYDCATTSWSAQVPVVEEAPPWWRRTPTIAAGLAVLTLLVLAGTAWGWWVRRRRTITAAPRRPTPGPGHSAPGPEPEARRRPSQGSGGIYLGGRPGGPRLVGDDPPAAQPGGGTAGGPIWTPRPAGGWHPPPTQRHRRTGPPIWLLVGLAATTLVGALTVLTWTASDRVTAVSADGQPSSGAWVGETTMGPVGAALRDSAFEFTVYRITCPPGTGQCEATVGLHNVSGNDQPWHGELQRAYLPDGNWVSLDETATLAVNAGRDLFAEPVPAGQRRLFPLVFTVPGADPPTRIELRSEVFSAGVSVDVP